MKTTRLANTSLKTVGELIAGIEYAMLTTREPGGTLHSRPMKTEVLQKDGTLLFITDASTAKARELQRDAHVSVTYIDGSAARCVAIAGRARVQRNPAKLRALWNPLYQVWFPKGLKDPHLALLQVTIERAEYWTTPRNPVMRLIGAAKALVKKEPIGKQIGDHAQMTLKRAR